MREEQIFENNCRYLIEQYPYLEKCLEERLGDLQEDLVQEYCTYDDELGLYHTRPEGIIQLNSQYEARNYADEWAEAVLAHEKPEWGSVIVVFGLGNGSYVKSLVEHLPERVRLIVYEPSREVFYKVMQLRDIRDIFQDKVSLLVENFNMEMFQLYWERNVEIENYKLVHYVAIPVYPRLYPEKFKWVFEESVRFNQILQVNWNSDVHYSARNTRNQIAKLPYLVRGNSLEKLIEQLPEQYPVIIVAAGPSLKKNIRELKQVKNKALLVAIDTALRLLLAEDIVPDLYVTIDAHKPLEVFADPRTVNIPVCVGAYSVNQVLEKHRDRIFFTVEDGYLQKLYDEFGKEAVKLPTGGTVSQHAFSLAVLARMNPIIMVGQDLAFTDEQTHAQGAYTQNESVEQIKDIEWVEDIYGKPVRTQGNLRMYKEWYEEIIGRLSKFRVIDATEGGAKIEGTEILDLRTAIARECTREYDFESVIRQIDMEFTEEEQQRLLEKYRAIPKAFQKIKRLAKEGEDKYDRLHQLGSRDGMDVKEVKRLTTELGKINKTLEEMQEYSLVVPYIKAQERQALTDMLEIEQDVRQDICNMAERGKLVMTAVKEAVPILLSDVEEMLKKL